MWEDGLASRSGSPAWGQRFCPKEAWPGHGLRSTARGPPTASGTWRGLFTRMVPGWWESPSGSGPVEWQQQR